MVKLSVPVTRSLSAASARAVAQAREFGRRAVRVGDGAYRCASAHQAITYTVTVTDAGRLEATCDCPHGQRPDAKGVCWHIAAALDAEIARVSRKPAAPAVPSAAAFAARLARP